MTGVRRMQVADNLNKVAQDLIDFILRDTPSAEEHAEHKAELLKILEEVSKQYEATTLRAPFLSLLEQVIHWYTRQRTSHIKSAQEALFEVRPGDKITFLYIIAGLLWNGACDSTSANTLLLNKLIAKMPQYSQLDEDARLKKLGWNTNASKIGIREALRDIFVKKARETVETYQRINEIKSKIYAVEKPKVGVLNLDGAIKNKLEKVFSRDGLKNLANRSDVTILVKPVGLVVHENYEPDQDRPAVARNVKRNYAHVIATLEKVNRDLLGMTQPVVEDAFELEAKRLREIGSADRQPSKAFLHAKAHMTLFFNNGKPGKSAASVEKRNRSTCSS